MRKITVLSMISLDGVMQAGGGPEEDTSGGFNIHVPAVSSSRDTAVT